MLKITVQKLGDTSVLRCHGRIVSRLCCAQHNADYIQLWCGDANLLRESLEAVQRTAAVILGGIAPYALT